MGDDRSGRVEVIERELSESELDFVQADFDRMQTGHGIPVAPRDRYTFIALRDLELVGCASGLRDNEWLYLSDLWIREDTRRQGLGSKLLARLEKRALECRLRQVYTWTAGFESPGFYLKQGYLIFAELESFYASGHARIGLRKALT